MQFYKFFEFLLVFFLTIFAIEKYFYEQSKTEFHYYTQKYFIKN